MSITRLRRWIGLANLALLGAGTVATGTWFWRAVCLDPGPIRPMAIHGRPAAAADPRKPSLDRYARIWDSPWVPSQQPPAGTRTQPDPESPPALTATAAAVQLAAALRLQFTVPNHRRPELGFACVSLVSAGPEDARLVGWNATVRAAYRVTRIEDEAVWFLVQGIVEAPLRFARGPGVIGWAGGAIGGRPLELEVRDEVPSGDARLAFVERARQISTALWEVDPDERRYLQEHIQILLQEVDVVPHVDRATDMTDGVELRAVAAGSLVAKRGFEVGDVIRSINGDAVGLASAPELMRKHRDASELVVAFSRRGVERTVTFRVR